MALCKHGLSPITGKNDHWWNDKEAECTKCKLVLKHSQFHKNNTNYSRRPVGTTCLKCTKDITFGYRRRDMRLNKYKNYKSIMRNEGNDCDMTSEEFLEHWPEDNKCPILGHELKMYPPEERGKWKGGRHYPFTPCVDHIDPRLPMSKKNLQVICWRANELKSDAIPEELHLLSLYMKDILPMGDSILDGITYQSILKETKWIGKYNNI